MLILVYEEYELEAVGNQRSPWLHLKQNCQLIKLLLCILGN